MVDFTVVGTWKRDHAIGIVAIPGIQEELAIGGDCWVEVVKGPPDAVGILELAAEQHERAVLGEET